MSNLANDEINRYRSLTYSSSSSAVTSDALFHLQWAWLERLVNQMDLAMVNAGVVHEPTRRDIIRAVLMGSPNEADAIYRAEQEQAMVEMIKWTPPNPITFGNGPPVR